MRFRGILRKVVVFIRILLYGVGCLILLGVHTLFTLILWGLAVWFLFANVLSEQQAEQVFWSLAGLRLKVFHGVDCHVPCEDRPTREELERLIAENQDAVRRLRELGAYPQVVALKENCPGKARLRIEYGGVGQIRAIGAILRQLEADTSIDIPCRFINV